MTVLRKARTPTLVRAAGRVSSVMEVQPPNARSPMVVRAAGRVS